MNLTYKDIINRILDAIDYLDDKEAFSNEFIELTEKQAISDLIATLSPEQQEQLKSALAANKEAETPKSLSELAEQKNDQSKVPGIIKAHFSEDQWQKGFENAAKNAVSEWMKAIDSTLNDAQRQKLMALSQELNPQISQAESTARAS